MCRKKKNANMRTASDCSECLMLSLLTLHRYLSEVPVTFHTILEFEFINQEKTIWNITCTILPSTMCIL